VGSCNAVCLPVQVFLIAGNRLLREALGRILRKRPDMQVSGESFDCAGAAESLLRDTDVVLMDGVATASLSLDFLADLRASRPNAQILAIGMDENEATFLKLVRLGIAGYLLKDASAADVIAAIRSVSQGDAVCPPRLCMNLFTIVARGERFTPAIRVKMNLGLTRREMELVPLIARGFTNKEIASRLNLSEQTIKNHIHRMLRKVGADDRLEVVEIASVRDATA
jgi:DNA-binding NarL/FixJ family response regulator